MIVDQMDVEPVVVDLRDLGWQGTLIVTPARLLGYFKELYVY